jgi:hypothetical protein
VGSLTPTAPNKQSSLLPPIGFEVIPLRRARCYLARCYGLWSSSHRLLPVPIVSRLLITCGGFCSFFSNLGFATMWAAKLALYGAYIMGAGFVGTGMWIIGSVYVFRPLHIHANTQSRMWSPSLLLFQDYQQRRRFGHSLFAPRSLPLLENFPRSSPRRYRSPYS